MATIVNSNTEILLSELKRLRIRKTRDVYSAIFLLEDGTLIDGCFNEEGHRVLDHDDIYIALGISQEAFFDTFNVVTLVPETEVAIFKPNQDISEEQGRLISNSNYITLQE